MTTSGDLVRPLGVTAVGLDDTIIANITTTAYTVGSPEVGTFFVAPASGTVRLTVGGGVRDNGGSNVDRIFLSPQLFRDDENGLEILAPSVTVRGYGSVAANTEFQYGSRVSLIEDLLPGFLYYVRVMYLTTAGTDPDTADIAARDIIVIPMP